VCHMYLAPGGDRERGVKGGRGIGGGGDQQSPLTSLPIWSRISSVVLASVALFLSVSLSFRRLVAFV